ncbi:MAG: HTTM domain-containing protein, partial [Bacteroidota bacterium]
PKYGNVFAIAFVTYFVIHIALPLRHHYFEDDVLWTEEGHRLSWRMMLRTKSGNITYRVIDEATNQIIPIKLDDYLTKKQQRGASTKPDIIWQFAQHLKKKFAAEGKNVQVFARCYVRVNNKRPKQLIDPKVDLANTEWSALKHSPWILSSK